MEKENPFKKIGEPPKEVPKVLKKKVMNNVNTLKFIMETASLFSTNYSNAVESFFKKRKSNKSTE